MSKEADEIIAEFGRRWPGKFIFALVRDRDQVDPRTGKPTCDVITNPQSGQEFADVRAFLVRLQIQSEGPHKS